MFEPIDGTLVIGLGHKARHGKDSAARILVETFGAQRFSFADDLYAVCRVLHGMTGKNAPLLQRVGLGIRDDDENALVRSVYGKLLDARPRVAVITDVRFPNEMAFVKALGGVCWKVERRLFNGDLYIDQSRPATHPSETALDGGAWDRVIVNPDGAIDTFTDRVREAYMSISVERPAVQPVAVGKFGYTVPDYAKMRA
jgi:hypothetical protein